jgi:hypothetical protein
MPNWCSNEITVSGPQSVITDLWEKAQAKQGLLEVIVPEPDYLVTPVQQTFPEVAAQYAEDEQQRAEILANEPAIREDGWWHWRVQNWGTKWDIGLEGLEFVDNEDGTAMILGGFESAWSPPTVAFMTYYQKQKEMGVDISIDLMYYEPGIGFAGRLKDDSEEEYDISNATADTVVDIVGEELNDTFFISESMEDFE